MDACWWRRTEIKVIATAESRYFHFDSSTSSHFTPLAIMSTFKLSKSEQKSRDPGIQSGDLVLVRLPKGDVRSVKLEKNMCVIIIHLFGVLYWGHYHSAVVIPKFGSFLANELVGQPYGMTYEIEDKKLKYVAPKTLDEIGTTCRFLSWHAFSTTLSRGYRRNQRINQWRRVRPTFDCGRNPGIEAIRCTCICKFKTWNNSSYFSLQSPK